MLIQNRTEMLTLFIIKGWECGIIQGEILLKITVTIN
jgi:hypothetical protein